MDTATLDPIANHLLSAYGETAIFASGFNRRYKQPASLMLKVHHLLSVVQSTLISDDRFGLGIEYSDFGRVEITDRGSGQIYLIRSSAAVSIERNRQQDPVLFDSATYQSSNVVLLVHRFHKQGLDLALAGARRAEGKKRLVPTGAPALIDTWPYLPVTETSVFEQGPVDAFDELGSIEELGDDGAL